LLAENRQGTDALLQMEAEQVTDPHAQARYFRDQARLMQETAAANAAVLPRTPEVRAYRDHRAAVLPAWAQLLSRYADALDAPDEATRERGKRELLLEGARLKRQLVLCIIEERTASQVRQTCRNDYTNDTEASQPEADP
jgi:hypothetical protein